MSYRKTTAVLEAKGSFKKNPQLKRVDPKTSDEIGPPPAYFDDVERRVWQEFIETSPEGVLTQSDRIILEIASTLLSDYRKNRASFNTSRVNILQRALASLGMTPLDRSRIVAPQPELDENNPWAELIRNDG